MKNKFKINDFVLIKGTPFSGKIINFWKATNKNFKEEYNYIILDDNKVEHEYYESEIEIQETDKSKFNLRSVNTNCCNVCNHFHTDCKINNENPVKICDNFEKRS